ncbi:MAG: nitrate reductase molybdenum cofactor assembly chaperone [Kineosporiaceae bacterium]
MFRAAHRHSRPAHAPTVWAAVSLLLDYPTAELVATLPVLRRVAVGLPGSAGVPLIRLIDHLAERTGDGAAAGLRELQEEYVQTFDHTRACALYLTYFAYGDTRRRGVALLEFKQAYRRGGAAWDEDAGELPDHLCAVLQFGATIDARTAWRLLLNHRAGIEMLRLALATWDRRDGNPPGSPWHDALLALCSTLPELKGDEVDAVRRLVEQGPPAEEVGLQPYLLDPQLDRPANPTPTGADLTGVRP